MGKDEPENFEMSLKSGEKEYFMRASPKGLVIGPKAPGTDDHLTVGMNEDDFSQVHRKINGREEWRLTSEGLQAEIESFMANNAEAIDPLTLDGPGTYVISLRRVHVLFSSLTGLASIPMNLLFPLFVTKKVVKTANGTEFQAIIETRRIAHVLSRAEPKIAAFFRVFGPPLSRIAASIAKRVGKGILLKPAADMMDGEGTVFLISDTRVGLMWENGSRLSYIPIAAIMQVYERAERNQPFGKLSEIGGIWTDSPIISGNSC